MTGDRALTVKERTAAEREGDALFRILESLALAATISTPARTRAYTQVIFTRLVERFSAKYL